MEEARIKSAIGKIRPAIQRDGGDVKFLSFDGETVKVKLIGACSCCPMAGMTLKNTIEKAIKSEVPSVKKVVAV
ncbi:NifU family protein [candidate division WOR-3 bacterium]|nr:NifU family protein [candidate division WOR-3 bacterium]